MPLLKNSRHEKFAQLVAGGMSATKAYTKAGYRALHADTAGPRLSGNVGVQARIAEIQGKAADLATWTVAERLEFLKESALTPASKVKISSRICQGKKLTKFGSVLLIPDKIKATVEYGRLAGDYKEKVELTGDGLLSLLEELRGGKKA